MTTKTRLNEIKNILVKALTLLESELASRPKQATGKPSSPRFGTVEWAILNKWDELKTKSSFTAHDAENIVKGGKRGHGTPSSFSAVLSRWAKDGYIELDTRGEGPFPAYYKISSLATT